MTGLSAIFSFLTFALLLSPAGAWEKPSREQLDSITRQGRSLFQYDEAVQRATTLLRESKVPTGAVVLSFSKKTETGREVVFGKLSDDGEAFLIVHRVLFPNKGEAKLETFAAPERNTDYYLSAVKSMGTALDHYRLRRRPYDYAIIPEGDDKFNVYIYPAVLTPGIHPLGGDAVFTISKNDFSVLDAKQLLSIESSPSKPE